MVIWSPSTGRLTSPSTGHPFRHRRSRSHPPPRSSSRRLLLRELLARAHTVRSIAAGALGRTLVGQVQRRRRRELVLLHEQTGCSCWIGASSSSNISEITANHAVVLELELKRSVVACKLELRDGAHQTTSTFCFRVSYLFSVASVFKLYLRMFGLFAHAPTKNWPKKGSRRCQINIVYTESHRISLPFVG